MIYCPKCAGCTVSYDTREHPTDNAQVRRRKCKECGFRFKTIENIINKGGQPIDAPNAEKVQRSTEGT